MRERRHSKGPGERPSPHPLAGAPAVAGPEPAGATVYSGSLGGGVGSPGFRVRVGGGGIGV